MTAGQIFPGKKQRNWFLQVCSVTTGPVVIVTLQQVKGQPKRFQVGIKLMTPVAGLDTLTTELQKLLVTRVTLARFFSTKYLATTVGLTMSFFIQHTGHKIIYT